MRTANDAQCPDGTLGSALALLQRLIAFPSVSSVSNLEITDWCAATLTQLGFSLSRTEYDDDHGVRKANLVAVRNPSAADRERAETQTAEGYTASRHHQWAGPGDGSRSRDEIRALEVLELDVDADFETVRLAWRRLAKSNHPDVRPGDKEAAARFLAIQAAYDVLKAAEDARTWKPGV